MDKALLQEEVVSVLFHKFFHIWKYYTSYRSSKLYYAYQHAFKNHEAWQQKEKVKRKREQRFLDL